MHPSEQSLSELEACMHAFYDYRLDKPLQSLDFIHTLKEFSPPEVKISDSFHRAFEPGVGQD